MKNTQLTELQLIQIDMLQKVVEVCEKNHLNYWMGDGSLLGGVRHKGFIPWDDDIDILMPYEDYKRFLSIAQDQLGDDYFLQTSLTDKCWYRVYATIRKQGTAMVQNARLRSHQGIWLDIFVIGNARNKFECKLQKWGVKFLNFFLMDHYMAVNKEEFMKMLTPIGYGLCKLFYLIPYRIRYNVRQFLFDRICRYKGGKYYPEIWCGITDIYDADCFEGAPSKIRFEGVEYNAPHNTDLFLRTQYGDDYMTPVKWERGHEKIILDVNNSYEKYLK